MGHYTFVVDIAAPREQVFDLWVNLDRSKEWTGGLSRVTDLSGPADKAGTTYVVHFGNWAKSQTTVLEGERPRCVRVKFGNWLLRGEQSAAFEETPRGTRLTQQFRTKGLIPAIAARIFATGSYSGSFRGELNEFKKICEKEAPATSTT